MKIAGILLIIAGFAAILCGGFSYTNRDRKPDMGLMQVDDTAETSQSHVRIPPALGLSAILLGSGLVFFGTRPVR
jgi:hypothetical protein